MNIKNVVIAILVASSLSNVFVCAADQKRIFINWHWWDSGEMKHRRKPVFVKQDAQVSMVKDEAIRDCYNNVPRSDMWVYKGTSFGRFGGKILEDDRVVENGEEFWIWSSKTLGQCIAQARAKGLVPSTEPIREGEKEEKVDKNSCLLS